MNNGGIRVVPVVLGQHVEDAAMLHAIRTRLLRAAHVRLKHLARFDERLRAHLDGLTVAGENAWPFLNEALGTPNSGVMFANAMQALDRRSKERLYQLDALAQAVPELRAGLTSALGWSEHKTLREIFSGLLDSSHSSSRLLGLISCALHRIDIGTRLMSYVDDQDCDVRARAMRSCGELGRLDLLRLCRKRCAEVDDSSAFWATWSAVLLGERGEAMERLSRYARGPGRFRERAFDLTMLALDAQSGREFLRSFRDEREQIRWAVRGAGISGDPAFVSWLISLMSDNKLSRLAGESFSLISGADLAQLDLEQKPPENREFGANDDPDDLNVELDEDEGLPWPDPNRVERWWTANCHGFQSGGRYFMGEGISRSKCLKVLSDGYQRQRILSALWLPILEPGSVLFEWRAPAWRQKSALGTYA